MRIVSDLLAPGGLLVISLRQGEDAERGFHPIATDALIHLATDCSGQQKPDKVLDSFSAFAGGKPLLYACGLTQL